MADDDITKDSQPSKPTPKPRAATTIDLPASEVTPSSSSATGDPAATESVASEKSSETPNRARVAFTPLLAAAIGGGAVAMGALWYFGFILARDVVTADMSARLGKLEAQPRNAAPPADQGIVNDIAVRIAKLEAATTSGPSVGALPAPRVAALEDNLKGIGNSVASLTSRHDDLRAQLDAVQKALTELRTSVAQQKGAADNSELDKVASRIAPLESAVQNVQQAIGVRDTNATDRAVRQALVASSLRDSVLRGVPFAVELAAFKATGGDAAAVAVLDPFAAQGIPAADKLCAEVIALLPKIAADAGTPAKPPGFLERLAVNAERLVRIRPIGEVAGTDNKAILARLELRATRSDVDGVLAELSQLPPQQRAPADAWIAKAKARQAALAAARDISTKSVGALAPQAQ